MPDRTESKVVVIIPVLNEEDNIGRVIGDIPMDRVDGIIVVDNGCTDATPERARAAGAVVVREPERGYGNACTRGLLEASDADVIVFLDGDYSDYPEETAALLDKLDEGYDMVVGSRVTGAREPGALPPHSLFGNWLISSLINLTAGTKYTDLGPFRAVDYKKLMQLGMCDPNYGWTVEMALRAAGARWRTCEIPVRYRKRHAGKSKVTGSITASVKTAFKMFTVLFRLQRILKKQKRGK